VGPRAVLDEVVKRKIPRPLRESNPRTLIVQPVAQSYIPVAGCCKWLDSNIETFQDRLLFTDKLQIKDTYKEEGHVQKLYNSLIAGKMSI
jgi:hypothetical protein